MKAIHLIATSQFRWSLAAEDSYWALSRSQDDVNLGIFQGKLIFPRIRFPWRCGLSLFVVSICSSILRFYASISRSVTCFHCNEVKTCYLKEIVNLRSCFWLICLSPKTILMLQLWDHWVALIFLTKRLGDFGIDRGGYKLEIPEVPWLARFEKEDETKINENI